MTTQLEAVEPGVGELTRGKEALRGKFFELEEYKAEQAMLRGRSQQES